MKYLIKKNKNKTKIKKKPFYYGSLIMDEDYIPCLFNYYVLLKQEGTKKSL